MTEIEGVIVISAANFVNFSVYQSRSLSTRAAERRKQGTIDQDGGSEPTGARAQQQSTRHYHRQRDTQRETKIAFGIVQGNDFQTYPPNILRSRQKPALVGFLCFNPRNRMK